MFAYDVPPAAPVVIYEDLSSKRDEFPDRRCGSGGVGGDYTSAVLLLSPELNYRGSGRLDGNQPQDRGSGR